MCGIFGVVVKENASVEIKLVKACLTSLARSSARRGKDSSGVVFRNDVSGAYDVLKGDISIGSLLNRPEYKTILRSALTNLQAGYGFQAMGHARLVTSGSQLRNENNQPVIRDNIIAIHNGIVVNDNELWERYADISRMFEIDTEIILALLAKFLKENPSLNVAVSRLFKEIKGTISSAVYFQDSDEFALFTNNGSFYYVLEPGLVMFSSEENFLQTFLEKNSLTKTIKQLCANACLFINAKTFESHISNVDVVSDKPVLHKRKFYPAKVTELKSGKKQEVVLDVEQFRRTGKESHLFRLVEYNINSIKALKRCTKCVLPETFPFITFDPTGTCNYCINYKVKNSPGRIENLRAKIDSHIVNGNRKCLVPFSGGRDSTYTLHYVKKELGLDPIAFTYDWGMVTDLARRNSARVCGKLGVENIIVAANIFEKRENIRKNLTAWLKKPLLGMVPLLMAGDKYFFYYSNKILKEKNLHLSVWGSNPLENTDFKSGFTGVLPKFNKKTIDEMGSRSKMQLISYFSKHILENPGYLNGSIVDSIGAFFSRYLIDRRGYFQLFDYLTWDEKEINDLLFNEYEWEASIDSPSTWRIGDGTAAFYNYVYLTVAGFSEFDTFRSNQIREGQLDRETALKLIESENAPRYESLRWYLQIINMDFESTIKQINQIPKLYTLTDADQKS